MRSYGRRTFGIAAALFLASCYGDSTGPAARHRVPLSIAPVFDSRDARAVLYDKVRILLTQPGTNALVLDTVVDFPATADSVVLAVSVPVQGPSQTFDLSLALFSAAAGDTVFRGGPVSVNVLPGVLNAAPAAIPMVYVGVGANATGVSFVTIPGPTVVGDTVLFVAQADTAGRPIPGTPIVYAVDARDTALASVPNPDVGRVAARSGRATARIVARLLTHLADTASLLIQPPPASIGVRSGASQSGAAGSALAQPVVVRVLGADNLGVAGVTVAFAATTGGGTVSPSSAVTDANGDASTTWTLGSLVGTQALTASVGGISSGAITAQASAASASKLAFVVQPVSAVAGAILPAVQVAAQDAFGNLFAGFSGTVTVALGSNPGGATLSGTLTAPAVSGLASFANLSLDRSGTGYTLVASTSGLTSATSAGFAITAGTAKSLSLVSGGNQSGAPGAQLALPVVVKVADSLGNGVSGRSVTFAASAGGSVGTASTATDALGLASTTWTLGTAAAESLTVTSAGLSGSPLTVTASASGIVSTTLTPHLDTLTALTATFQLTAQSRDAVGGLVSGTYTWASRAPAIATVGTTGLVTAVTNGSTWVVATEAGGTKDSAQIVVQQRIATVNVTPGARNIYLTRWYSFTAAAVDGKGFAVPGTPTFTWTSTAPAVATVDATGLVTGVGLGAAQIRATTGGVTGVANVQIITPITRIAVVVDTIGAVKTDTFTMPSLGLTRRYRAIAHDTLDAVMSGLSFTWVSTNGSVAQMLTLAGDTASVLSAANGYTQVQATAQGFTSAPGASLTVSQVLASIALSPVTPVIGIGGTVALTARGLDANARFISGGTFRYHSSTPTIATVDSLTGIVTGVALGADTVTATSGAITSNPAIVAVSNTGVPKLISFGRDTVSVGRGSTAQIPILLSQPSQVGAPITVNLTVNPQAYAHWSTPSVTIPVGQTTANATLVGDSAGTTTVIATEGTTQGYSPDTAVAKVTANMRLTSSGYAINATDVVATQVLLSDPSPAGGTYVTFSYGTTGIASVSPDPAYIPAGQLAADIQIRGLAGGSTTITPVAIGVNGTASSFTAYPPLLRVYYGYVRLGQGQFDPNDYVYLPTTTNVPVVVTLTSSDTTVATVTPSVTIPAGYSYAYYTRTAQGTGAAAVTLAATGWTMAGTDSILVTPPKVGVTGGTTLYTTSPLTSVYVYAEDSTGTAHDRVNALVVRLHSSDSTIMRVVDSVVTIQPGGYYTTGRVVPGGNAGTAWIVATASGHSPDSTRYTVLGPPLGIYYGSVRLGAGQQDGNNYVYIPNALSVPLVVKLASRDSTKLSVPDSVIIPVGYSYAYFTALGLSPDTVTVTATAANYQSTTTFYTVTTPGVYGVYSGTVNNFSNPVGLTVYAADSASGVHVRTAPLTVSISTADTNVIRIDSSSVTIAAGQYLNNLAHYVPVGVGTAVIRFSAPGHLSLDTVVITVVQPSLAFYYGGLTLGRRQSIPNTQYVYTPNSRLVPVPLTLTHSLAGVDSISPAAPVIDSATNYKYLSYFGTAVGTDTVTASAASYNPASTWIRVTTPRFTDGSLPGNVTTTNPPFLVYVYAADSLRGTHYAMDTVVVAVTSSDPTVIRPSQAYVRIPAGAYYTTDTVTVLGPGSAYLVFSDSAGTGYQPDTTNTMTVTGPSLALTNYAPVLGMRQNGGSGSYYVSVPNAPAADLTVNLLSTDPRVATVPATVTILANQSSATFNVTAQDTIGTIQVQASATGYGGAATNIRVTQPEFVVSTASQLNTTSPPAYVTIYAADANGTAHYANENVVVTLGSSAPSVATIDSPTVTIPAGAYYVNTPRWSPNPSPTPGTAQLQASDPRAAFYHYNAGTFNVTVVYPSLSMSWGNESLGIGQYIDNEWARSPDVAAAPIAVAFAHTGTARIETDTGGVASTGVTIPAGNNYGYFRILGLSAGTDTLTASAASPYHNPVTAYTVVDLGTTDPLGGLPTSLKAGDSTQVTLYARAPNGSTRYVLAATTFTLAPNANVQFVTGGVNSVVITSAVIPAGAYYTTFWLKGVSTGTGSATITATNYQPYTPSLTITP